MCEIFSTTQNSLRSYLIVREIIIENVLTVSAKVVDFLLALYASNFNNTEDDDSSKSTTQVLAPQACYRSNWTLRN